MWFIVSDVTDNESDNWFLFVVMNNILLKAVGDLPGYLWIALISSAQFIFAIPVSYIFGNSFLLTILITSLAGISGILFFHYLIRYAFFSDGPGSRMYFNVFRKIAGFKITSPAASRIGTRCKRRNRLLVRFFRRYVLAGVYIHTPILLSIPLGAILTYRYSPGRAVSLVMPCVFIVTWPAV